MTCRIDPSEVGLNMCALLDAIAYSEGTPKYGDDDGYNVIVGGALFDDYSDHPRRLVQIRSGLASTAAGRYQLLERYYDAYKKLIGVPDFSPISQDKIAIQQIKECRATMLVDAGNFEGAVAKVAHIWASLPGAGYGQHENTMAALTKAYLDAGGSIA